MAIYGSALEEGKSPDQALEAVKTVLEKTVAQPGSGRDAFSAFSQGQGNVLLTYENEAIKAEKEGEDVEYVIPLGDAPDRNPDRGHRESGGARRGRFPQVPLVRRRPGTVGRKRLPPGQPEAGRPEAVPDSRRRCSRSASSAAGARSTTNSSTKKPARSPRSRVNSEFRPQADVSAPGNRRHQSKHPGRGIRLPGVGAGLGRGLVVLYLSVLVLLPLAALTNKSLSGGLGHFSEQVTQPQAVSSLELTLVASLIVVLINGFFGTILAWLLVRDEFPGKAVVNAVIDLPFALPTIVASLILIELWGTKSPLGIDIALSRRRGRGRPALRHPPLRRPRRAAAADRDGPRDGGGGCLAGRRWLHGLPPHHLPQPAAGPCRRHRPCLRPCPGRVRLRSALRRRPAGNAGLLGLHQAADRERQRSRRRRRLDRALGRLGADARAGRPGPALGQPPRALERAPA